MPRSSQVKLFKQVKISDKWALALVLFDSKGRVRKDHVLVNCQDENHPEGSYFIEWWDRGQRYQEAVGPSGLSGESSELERRVPALQLGPYTLRQPVAMLSRDAKGLLACPDFDALIGGEILSRFTTSFDYRSLRIFLEPNSHFADPFGTDASGLLLQATGAKFDQFEITGIAAGSPAEIAGLQKGDVLKAVDLQPITALDLATVRSILQKSGSTVGLTVERNGKTLNATLNLSAPF